ncbi:hypothetical protein CcCBS67573_g02418 [Chytriomyces confervae]|uniref:SPIN90/Ldb17 leucine-rich domain-containing protein n=1 Tax=Chytriomyces confervae TaxID=246404 RepID=A0A507FJ04_9FUNG|nr:hypothetical protein HDU80_006648 [Chytriomyces hyalinus]TPX76284.1 hypothetical protein CcCBS67573_g02418 [Chytriomyces confervae]
MSERLYELVTDLHAALDTAADADSCVDSVVNLLTDNSELIRSDNDMEILCEDVLRHSCVDSISDDALAELLCIWRGLHLTESAEPSQLERGFVVLSLAYYLGHVYGANVFRKIGQYMDSLLIPVVSNCSRHRVHIPAVRLLYEVCLLQELSLSELDEFSMEMIAVLLDSVEKTACSDQLEEYNFSILKLLLALNDQYMKKNHAREVIENRIIACLATRLYMGKSLGANVIFMFNRADNPRVQRLIIRFFMRMLKSDPTSGFFYTNDLKVMLDVILREARSVADENEELQQGYLNVLPPLLHNPQIKGYKAADVSVLLSDLRRVGSSGGADSPRLGSPIRSETGASSPMTGVMGTSGVRPSTRRVAERVFLECRDVLLVQD